MDTTTNFAQEEWERLEAYLLGELPPDEHKSMDEELTSDASLRQKLAEVELLLLGVKEAALQQRLQAFHRDMAVDKNGPRMGRRSSSLRTWLVAASILVVTGAATWLLLLRGSSDERLFAAYFKPDPGLITAMSATDNYAFEKAMIDYKRGEYAIAIQTWDSLQKAQPFSDTLHYFLGVAHLAEGNSGNAVSYLEKVAGTKSLFSTDAWWYLGLALLIEGKKEAAVKALEKASHHRKEELLLELDKVKK